MEHPGALVRIFLGFLYLLSLPYQFFVYLRNWAFDHGIFEQYDSPVPVVVSIGNIVAGGTGKTPMAVLIASAFSEEMETAVCSRGYRSPAERLAIPLQLSKGEGPIHPAGYCGDEPYLISQNVPKALCFVGKDRKKAANMAAKAGAKLLILDDGMQHRQLARDLEIVVIDAKYPFGHGYFLPRGMLRDSPAALSRADLIAIANLSDPAEYSSLALMLAGYSKAPVMGVKLETSGVYYLSGDRVDSLKGKKVGIFCGIAHPDSFEKTVSQLGAEIVSREFSSDHVGLDERTLLKFAERAKKDGASLLLCTEKDKVKLREEIEPALPIAWVKCDMKIVEGHASWEAFISKIGELVQARS